MTTTYIESNRIPKDKDGQEIERGACLLCERCVGFLSESYTCSCSHAWHAHVPHPSEEQSIENVRYRRAGKADTNCQSYYPIVLPPTPTTRCYCGGLPNEHIPRSSLVSRVASTTLPSVSTSSTSAAGPFATGAALPSSGERIPPILAIFSEPDRPIAIAPRQRAEAREQFHGGTALTARAHAPQPTLRFAAATTTLARPRLGHSNAPTTQVVHSQALAQANATVDSAQTPRKLNIVVIPIRHDGNAQILSGEKLKRFLERLHRYGLVFPYQPSSDIDKQKGVGLIRHMHDAIVLELRRSGYYMEGTANVPVVPEEISWNVVPWLLVWHPIGGKRKGYVSDESGITAMNKLSLTSFGKSPWGTGKTRPRIDPEIKESVVMIMMRGADLLGREPAMYSDRARNLQNWRNGNEEVQFLHRCMGRQVMNGYRKDNDLVNVDDYPCQPNAEACMVASNPETYAPIDWNPPQDDEWPVPALDLTLDPVDNHPSEPSINRSLDVSNVLATTSASNIVTQVATLSSVTMPGVEDVSRVRPRSISMEEEEPPRTRRRTTAETPLSLTPDSLFPDARSSAIPSAQTITENENLVERFINAVITQVQQGSAVSLTARNESVTAIALYNFILAEGNRRYRADTQLLEVDSQAYDWFGSGARNFQSLFRSDFNIVLMDPHDWEIDSMTVGDGPKIATLRQLIDLALSDVSTFHQQDNEAGYRNIAFDTTGLTDPCRLAKLWTAGVISALHILKTMTGPYPLNPFLIYCSLESNMTRLVNEEFIQLFDTDIGSSFFPSLALAENRKIRGEMPWLLPLQMFYASTRGGNIATEETPSLRSNRRNIEHIVITTLGEMLGLRDFIGESRHPDFTAFSIGLRDCLDTSPERSRLLWPSAQHTREFIALLYNRRPKEGEDVNAHTKFESCCIPRFLEDERRWEDGIRRYLLGSGIPLLARWSKSDAVKGVDFNGKGGRATQMLMAMTGSDLMPATDHWTMTFKFRHNPLLHLDGFTAASDARAITIEIRACFKQAYIDFPNPIMSEVIKCPELFEAQLHLIFTGQGFSGEIH